MSITTHGYCFKCKEWVLMNEVKIIELRGGKKAVEGLCPLCKTRFIAHYI